MSKTKATLVDIFCGAGGLSSGFIQAGFEVIAAADLDDAAVSTYRANLGGPVAKIDLSRPPGRASWRDGGRWRPALPRFLVSGDAAQRLPATAWQLVLPAL